MTDLQIQYFLTVTECGSFTDAAEHLFVSQPAVSKQIRLLEKELGHQLFSRNSKTILPTRAGETFYDFFMQCRFQMDLLQTRLREQAESGQFPIRIGYLEGQDPSHFLPQMKQACESIDASVRLSFFCYPLPELLSALQNGQVDVILTFGSMLIREAFYSEPLTDVSRVLLCSAAHFPEPPEDIGQFRQQTFFLPQDGYTAHLEQVLHNIFLEFGFAPRIVYAPNFMSIMDSVERGDGVFVYNEWCRQCSLPSFRHLKLPGAQTLYLTRKDRHASLELLQFCENLRKLLKG